MDGDRNWMDREYESVWESDALGPFSVPNVRYCEYCQSTYWDGNRKGHYFDGYEWVCDERALDGEDDNL